MKDFLKKEIKLTALKSGVFPSKAGTKKEDIHAEGKVISAFKSHTPPISAHCIKTVHLQCV